MALTSLIDQYTHGVLAALPSTLQGTKILNLAAGDSVVLQMQKSLASSLNITSAYLNAKLVKSL